MAIPPEFGKKLEMWRGGWGEKNRSAFVVKLLRHSMDQATLDQRIIRKYKKTFDKIYAPEEKRIQKFLKSQRQAFFTP